MRRMRTSRCRASTHRAAYRVQRRRTMRKRFNRSIAKKLAQAQRTQGSFVPALSERTGSKPPDLELKPLEQSLEQRAQPVDDGAQTDAQLRTLPPLPAPSP